MGCIVKESVLDYHFKNQWLNLSQHGFLLIYVLCFQNLHGCLDNVTQSLDSKISVGLDVVYQDF